METLPLEMKEAILLETEDPSSLCLSSPEFYALCSKDSFWLKKFRLEGLPLPPSKPSTVGGWIRVYRRTLNALEKSERSLRNLPISWDLGEYPSLSFLNSINHGELNYLWESSRLSFILREELRREEDPLEREYILKDLRSLGNTYLRAELDKKKGKFYLLFFYPEGEKEEISLTPEEAREILLRYFWDYPQAFR